MQGEKAKRLPKYLLADPAKGYSFVRKPKGKDELYWLQDLLKCDRVQLVAGNDRLFPQSSGYELYMDEEAMLKDDKVVNMYANPLVQDQWLEYQAEFGGPYGLLVVVATSVHSRVRLEDFPGARWKAAFDPDDLVSSSYATSMANALHRGAE